MKTSCRNSIVSKNKNKKHVNRDGTIDNDVPLFEGFMFLLLLLGHFLSFDHGRRGCTGGVGRGCWTRRCTHSRTSGCRCCRCGDGSSHVTDDDDDDDDDDGEQRERRRVLDEDYQS